MNGIKLWQSETDRGKLKYGQKTVPVPLRPPQTAHELASK